MRIQGHAIALVVTVVAACGPTATQTTSPSPTTAVATSAPSATPQPTASAEPTPTPAGILTTGPVSAGRVPDAGTLFFPDYDARNFGLPDHGRTFDPAFYRYDGTTGMITKLTSVPWSPAISHETAQGVYLRGPQGRWDFMRWDGTLLSDEEFTACQIGPNYFASWCDVSATGAGVHWGTHVGDPCDARIPKATLRLPGAKETQPIMPDGTCVIGAQISDDGTRILASTFESGAQRLWLVTIGGTPQRLQLPADLKEPFADLSPDGRMATAYRDGRLWTWDLASGRTTLVGSVPQLTPLGSLPRWSNGRLAAVRGSGDTTFADRTVVVASPDGTVREMRAATLPIGLAPAWDPSRGRLAWIAGPAASAGSDSAREHLEGKGVGDRRVLVSDLTSEPVEIRCGEGAAEGVRWSHDGTALLLLCRRPGSAVNAFDLWLHRIGGTASPLVRGLTLGSVAPTGHAPSLFGTTAWSRAATP